MCYVAIQAGDPNASDIALFQGTRVRSRSSCARVATQILGGIGCMRGNGVEWIYHEVRVNAVGGGSEEIM